VETQYEVQEHSLVLVLVLVLRYLVGRFAPLDAAEYLGKDLYNIDESDLTRAWLGARVESWRLSFVEFC
jgi:hypothetical protein